MQSTKVMSELQASYGSPGYIFEKPPVRTTHQVTINTFLEEWITDQWQTVWYCSVAKFFTVIISMQENKWSIECNGKQEAGGYFLEEMSLEGKKAYVQKQVEKVIGQMAQW